MWTGEVNKSENHVDVMYVLSLSYRTHRNPSVLPTWKLSANNRMRVATIEILIPLMTTERLRSDG